MAAGHFWAPVCKWAPVYSVCVCPGAGTPPSQVRLFRNDKVEAGVKGVNVEGLGGMERREECILVERVKGKEDN